MEKLKLLTFENIVEPLLNESVSFIYFPIEWLDIVEIHYKLSLIHFTKNRKQLILDSKDVSKQAVDL